MTVITTTTSTPNSISLSANPSAVISQLAPALIHSASLLSNTALFLILRTSIITHILLQQTLYASQIVVLRAAWATAVVTRHSFAITRRGCRALWKRSEKLRDKVFFEFMVWILNPNALALLIFWPGWLLLAGIYGVWKIC